GPARRPAGPRRAAARRPEPACAVAVTPAPAPAGTGRIALSLCDGRGVSEREPTTVPIPAAQSRRASALAAVGGAFRSRPGRRRPSRRLFLHQQPPDLREGGRGVAAPA